jgi:hypothetical protein
MTPHLDDQQLADLLAGRPSAATERHLGSCPSCAAERDRLAGALADWHADAARAAERPEAFWQQQRREIRARLAAAPPERSRTVAAAWWAAAAVAAVLALLVGLDLRHPHAGHVAQPTPGPLLASSPVAAAAGDHRGARDDALLRAVEGAVAHRTPEALAPAEALLRELERTSGGGGALPAGRETS